MVILIEASSLKLLLFGTVFQTSSLPLRYTVSGLPIILSRRDNIRLRKIPCFFTYSMHFVKMKTERLCLGLRYVSSTTAVVDVPPCGVMCAIEHSNSRFESIRFDSLCESIRFVKKSAFRFTSCHAVFLYIYCIDSAKE